jgi:hypothetical protein
MLAAAVLLCPAAPGEQGRERTMKAALWTPLTTLGLCAMLAAWSE